MTTPPPPACIARALARLDWSKPHDDSVISRHEYARAVWDALLAEGQIVQHADWGEQTLLVLPLPRGDS